MKKLIALWNWFNGKKTYIGAAILAGTVPVIDLLEQPFAILHYPVPLFMPTVVALILWVGTVLTTIGGLHKMIKYKASAVAANN